MMTVENLQQRSSLVSKLECRLIRSLRVFSNEDAETKMLVEKQKQNQFDPYQHFIVFFMQDLLIEMLNTVINNVHVA